MPLLADHVGMGLRFRQFIKLLPRVRFNPRKTRVSISIGRSASHHARIILSLACLNQQYNSSQTLSTGSATTQPLLLLSVHFFFRAIKRTLFASTADFQFGRT